MLKRLIIVGPLFFALTNALGQTTPPILTVSEFKQGIYKSYSEFLQNAPSVGDRFTYVTNSSERKKNRDEASYRLILIDSIVRRRDMKKFWGFSDGKNVFVNEVMISGRLTFRKFQGLGRYCYLFATPPSQTIAPITPELAAGYAANALVRAIDGDEPYVLNVNNGKFFMLDKKVLTTILAKDPPLLQQYKLDEERRKETTFIDYVYLYNQTHLHEANSELWYERDVIVYRDTKKEIPGELQITVNDTLTLSLKPNTVHRFKAEGEDVKICSGQQCTDIKLVRKGINYISTSLRKEGSPVIIKKADDEEGRYRVADIQKAVQ